MKIFTLLTILLLSTVTHAAPVFIGQNDTVNINGITIFPSANVSLTYDPNTIFQIEATISDPSSGSTTMTLDDGETFSVNVFDVVTSNIIPGNTYGSIFNISFSQSSLNKSTASLVVRSGNNIPGVALPPAALLFFSGIIGLGVIARKK